jgi:hypothetical protein
MRRRASSGQAAAGLAALGEEVGGRWDCVCVCVCVRVRVVNKTGRDGRETTEKKKRDVCGAQG